MPSRWVVVLLSALLVAGSIPVDTRVYILAGTDYEENTSLKEGRVTEYRERSNDYKVEIGSKMFEFRGESLVQMVPVKFPAGGHTGFIESYDPVTYLYRVRIAEMSRKIRMNRMELFIGTNVRLQGLTKARSLNGKMGIVMKGRGADGRYTVRAEGLDFYVLGRNLRL
jgi:hypothetical protein